MIVWGLIIVRLKHTFTSSAGVYPVDTITNGAALIHFAGSPPRVGCNDNDALAA
jgi:hypothetical protein